MLFSVLQEKRYLVLKAAREHGIKNVQVFGAVEKFEDGPNIDINLLVEFEEGRSLFDLVSIKQEIEDLLQIKVNVLTENSIHWSMKEDVLNRAIPL